MNDSVRVHGYRYSVYNRIARLTLTSKSVAYTTVEVDPFTEIPASYLALHPFGRVPTLEHGSFRLFETNAISRYVDRAFVGPPLQPDRPKTLARMDQVISAIDAYAYVPMVRQVFANAFFRPLAGQPSNRAELAAGLAASRIVLSFLDDVAKEGEILNGQAITLADCHLAPIIDYFVRVAEGRDALSPHPALRNWWEWASGWDALRATDPFAD